MSNNKFIGLLLLGSVVLGALGGYFVFLGVYQEQFLQQEHITLENFDSANITLRGTIVETAENTVIIEREGLRFSIKVGENTLILVPDEAVIQQFTEEELAGRLPEERPQFIKEGTLRNLFLGTRAVVAASFEKGVFQAVSITVPPVFQE